MADILILTASFGMGHKSVSNALKEQIETENKNAEVVIADIWEILNPKVKDFSSKIYCELTENYPLVYNTFYEIKMNYKNNIIDNVFCSLYQKKFYEYLKLKKPRTVISTFPLCSCMISKIKEEYELDINLITVITDVVDSWEWIYKGTNIYLVPTEEIKNRIIHKGVSGSTILVTGIPVKKGFISENINLSIKDKHSILIVLSGIDNVPESVLSKLDQLDNFDIMLVTGRNERLFEKLSKSTFSNIKVYGYVDNMNQMMDESLFIVTKPGGVTIFEAINKELPLIVLNSNIGQEKGNIEFIKKNKIGVVINDFENLPSILSYYANNQDIINYYCENIRKIKKTLNYTNSFCSVLNEVI
ncbi:MULTISPECIES: MGDG synthase family glycosyltransferase [unclassified Sedimentibacter]|uniref:MGDG synthase family glycosyltransferase n=1 Tax=unclassified Sedimentibacter TaxID=2649220 RepID=UPI0027E02890|nr:glycosyltransferase [Sedimentibacter sp. MB35-C1]WMJ75997.1 glycosyltransferase [Sedimentibacter sp. MB35-C1]